MVINCFRGASRRESEAFETEPVPRRVTLPIQKKATLKRVATNTPSVASSSSRTSSNASIALLPPCPHLDDPKIEAMMMPVPVDCRPPTCLRLSYPKIYSNIVADMKETKGCRDWRNFAVFENDDVDMNVSAIEYGRKKAQDYQKRVSALKDF